jgi:uncharacterized cupredoxin-like copper-binding protein
MKKSVVIFSLFLVVSLLLVACTSGGSGSNATLNVAMTEFQYTPNTWTVSAGQKVTINLTNQGTLAHTWTIMSEPISGSYASADQSDIFFTSPAVPAGTSQTVTFTAPTTPGTYQVICTQPGHFEAGMEGELTVK